AADAFLRQDVPERLGPVLLDMDSSGVSRPRVTPQPPTAPRRRRTALVISEDSYLSIYPEERARSQGGSWRGPKERTLMDGAIANPNVASPAATAWHCSPAVRTALGVLLVCAGYYASGVVSLITRFPSSGISTIWAATAVLLAALLLLLLRTWWLYVLALLPPHLHLVVTFQGDVPLPVMLCQYAGNVAHAVLSAVLVRRVVRVPPRLEDLRSMATFILLAGLAVPW